VGVVIAFGGEGLNWTTPPPPPRAPVVTDASLRRLIRALPLPIALDIRLL